LDLTAIDATDTVVVDSLVLGDIAERLIPLPARLVLLLHVVPAFASADARGGRVLKSLCERARLVVTGDDTLRLVRLITAIDSLDAVKIEPGIPRHWRSKTGYADRARSLLAVANYVRGKGIGRVLDVLAQLRDLPWRLTLHGNPELDPAYFAEVADKIDAYRLRDRIELSGPVPHAAINRKMLEADLLVHFSEYESYSMVTAEAIASGLPVLSSRTGNSDGFSRSGLVRYLDASDSSEADVLGSLIDDERTYAELRPTGCWRTRTCLDVGREFLKWLGRG
jgi:glycosyltransferase involved in cell wall biosynthesis